MPGWLAGRESIARTPSSKKQRSLDLALFGFIWPIYGFSIALFLGQLTPRPVIAAIVTAFTVPALLALWVPSFLIGGLPGWQVAIIPLLLLLASAASQHAWISGRLLSARSISTIVVFLVAMGIWLVGSLWHRVSEVPDVGEPFDVSAFLSELPAESDTGPELISAIRNGFALFQGETPQTPPSSESDQIISRFQFNPFDRTSWSKYEKFIGPQLDTRFDSKWYANLQQLAEAPLGLTQDVRKNRAEVSTSWNNNEAARLGNLMDWRVGQLIEKPVFRSS